MSSQSTEFSLFCSVSREEAVGLVPFSAFNCDESKSLSLHLKKVEFKPQCNSVFKTCVQFFHELIWADFSVFTNLGSHISNPESRCREEATGGLNCTLSSLSESERTRIMHDATQNFQKDQDILNQLYCKDSLITYIINIYVLYSDNNTHYSIKKTEWWLWSLLKDYLSYNYVQNYSRGQRLLPNPINGKKGS